MTTQKVFEQLYMEIAALYSHTEAQLISRYVFQDVFQMTHHDINKEFSQENSEKLMSIQERLLNHEPWQHVVGLVDFYGMKFHVSPDVLIPRPETEELVALVLESLLPQQSVLDIGTGSGCIPIVLKKEAPDSNITSLDISPDALAMARKNAEKHHVDIDFKELDIRDQDLWKIFKDQKFDVVVSNPPYVLESEKSNMDAHVADFDPALALFVPDQDPLLFYKTISEFALQFLADGGHLFFEIHQDFGSEMKELLEIKGFKDIEVKKDLSGNDRFVMARVSR